MAFAGGTVESGLATAAVREGERSGNRSSGKGNWRGRRANFSWRRRPAVSVADPYPSKPSERTPTQAPLKMGGHRFPANTRGLLNRFPCSRLLPGPRHTRNHVRAQGNASEIPEAGHLLAQRRVPGRHGGRQTCLGGSSLPGSRDLDLCRRGRTPSKPRNMLLRANR
jgi:hypothetical protein